MKKGITVSNDEIEVLLDEEPKEETKDEKEKRDKTRGQRGSQR